MTLTSSSFEDITVKIVSAHCVSDGICSDLNINFTSDHELPNLEDHVIRIRLDGKAPNKKPKLIYHNGVHLQAIFRSKVTPIAYRNLFLKPY